MSASPATATIFAPATAPGKAGVMVMRISGPAAATAVTALCRPATLPLPRTATLRDLHTAEGDKIDKALLLYFPAPHSFTGEDVLELHCHGGRAILDALTKTLSGLAGFRPAEAGEFTRRGFENGKFDLTEAEAIADLVAAETAAQRQQALRQLEGELGNLYNNWADRLKRILAMTEADIDFADEDLPPDLAAKESAKIAALLSEISAHLNDAQRGEKLREGFTIAIIGPPNAGKSSLLNTLAKREAAIVSHIPGTTRDIIEVHLDINGFPVSVADTAGLRHSADLIEQEGIARAHARARAADLKLALFDGATWPAQDEATTALIDDNTLIAISKSDLIAEAKPPAPAQMPASSQMPAAMHSLASSPDILHISTKTGENIALLLEKLGAEISNRFAPSAAPALTRARHRHALENTQTHLARALTAPEAALRAEDLRLALRSLGRITGLVDVEDLLDVIFKEFCIGK